MVLCIEALMLCLHLFHSCLYSYPIECRTVPTGVPGQQNVNRVPGAYANVQKGDPKWPVAELCRQWEEGNPTTPPLFPFQCTFLSQCPITG